MTTIAGRLENLMIWRCLGWLVNSLSRLSSIVQAKQEHLCAAWPCRRDHSLADAKTHLPWSKVGNHHDQSSHQLFRFIGLLDPGEDVALLVSTQAERQLE